MFVSYCRKVNRLWSHAISDWLLQKLINNEWMVFILNGSKFVVLWQKVEYPNRGLLFNIPEPKIFVYYDAAWLSAHPPITYTTDKWDCECLNIHTYVHMCVYYIRCNVSSNTTWVRGPKYLIIIYLCRCVQTHIYPER